MAPTLLLVPSIFLTIIGLSNFYSLNSYFAAIFQSINSPIASLSRSAFTIMPSYVSTFSIPISIYTSLSILNILLTSLAIPSAYALPCYTFSFVGHAIFSSFLFYFRHPHYSASSNFLSLRTSCSMLSFLYISFFLHHLHSI